MKDLRCGKSSCKHNGGYCCNAKKVCVDCNTDCTTYEEAKDAMVEFALDNIPSKKAGVDTCVKCSARCLFNRDSSCVATGITITSSDRKEAQCLTFIKI